MALNNQISQTDLKHFDWQRLNNYVPIDVTREFLDYLLKRNGIDRLGHEFFDDISVADLGETVKPLMNATSMLDGLLEAEKLSHVYLSNEVMRLKVKGVQSEFSVDLTNISMQRYQELMQIDFIFVLNGLIHLAAENWQPLEIHCQKGFIPNSLECFGERLKNTRFLFDQTSTKIVFKTQDLAYSNQEISSNDLDIQPIEIGGIKHKIELLISSYSHTVGPPNIRRFALLLGVSERTLRRKLLEEGVTFKQLFTSWRIRTALQLLEQPQVPIKEIAFRLHYSNPNNFIRAFNQSFGCSPNRYRQAL